MLTQSYLVFIFVVVVFIRLMVATTALRQEGHPVAKGFDCLERAFTWPQSLS